MSINYILSSKDKKIIRKNKIRFNELTDQEYKFLAETMDRRYDFFKKLRMIKEKYGDIPDKYQKQWDEFIVKDGGFLWHEQADAVKTLRKAAEIHALRRLKSELD